MPLQIPQAGLLVKTLLAQAILLFSAVACAKLVLLFAAVACAKLVLLVAIFLFLLACARLVLPCPSITQFSISSASPASAGLGFHGVLLWSLRVLHDCGKHTWQRLGKACAKLQRDSSGAEFCQLWQHDQLVMETTSYRRMATLGSYLDLSVEEDELGGGRIPSSSVD